MRKNNLRGRFLRAAAVIAVGGSAFQQGGCDPAVRSALLTGLEDTTTSLSGALISAFFISLEDDSASNAPVTTTGSP